MEKLRNLRKKRGFSQEKLAGIIATDPSNYSRKERGEIRIYDDEWEKLAAALNVTVEEIKEEKPTGIVHNDNSTFSDNSNSGNFYNQQFNIPDSVIENLQDYIKVLKEQIETLKEENQKLKSK